jgi:two-component system invasion response regulator UvrY
MRAQRQEKDKAIRVIICDDHPIVRQGVRLVINASKDIALEDEAAEGNELLEKIRKRSFDVVILDISLQQGPEGLEIIKSIQAEQPKPAVLVLSMHPEEQSAVRALRAGAAGYLVKGCEPQELLSAIRKIAAGGKYITPTLAEILADDIDGGHLKPPHKSLSDREYKVLCLLAGGKSVSEAARELCLSPSTIGTYRSRILDKIGLKTNADLVRYAMKHGLLDD